MKRPAWILAAVCLPVFLGALDLTIISAVLPAVVADLEVPLQTGLDDAAWAVTGYLLAYAVSMTFMGRVSDLLGRRRVYLLCLIVFFLGSWLVAASPGAPAELAYRIARALAGGRPDRSLMALYALIFGRVVQAFGAGAMVPVSMALAADLFPPQRRALPLGVIGAVDTAGWVLGHLYGGVMVQFFAWPVLFWINLPLIAVLFGLTVWAFKGLPAVRERVPMDWIGVLWITLTLAGLNLGLAAGDASAGAAAEAGISPVPLALGLLAFAVFIWHELRAPRPLLDLRLFRNRNVSASGALNLLVGFCLMAGLVSVPLFINLAGAGGAGQGALVSGYLLSAFTIPLALAAIPGGLLTARIGYRLTTLTGMSAAALGFGLMTTWRPEMAAQAVALFTSGAMPDAATLAGTLHMAAGLALAGIGLGLTIAPVGTAVINGADESQRGIAAAAVIILRLIGMSLSVSLLTTYGLRRTAEISAALLEGVPLTDLARTLEAGLQTVTRVTAEMAWIALSVAAAGLIPALLLRRGDE
ncbi:MAG: MFS transporter [Anaerolineales bacterium]|nr:MFS transporter [Anaerolineales bacterium]